MFGPDPEGLHPLSNSSASTRVTMPSIPVSRGESCRVVVDHSRTPVCAQGIADVVTAKAKR